MASTAKRKSSRRRSGKRATPLVRHERKKEVLGLVLIVLSLLVSLAVVSYTPDDNAVAQGFSLAEALDPGDNRAQNLLGLTGAAIAFWLVPGFLGYFSLLIVGLVFAWGYVAFRRKSVRALPLITGLTVISAFLLATLAGWSLAGAAGALDPYAWSGSVGLAVAGWMDRVFGSVGAVALVLLLLAVVALLAVDRDIQRSLDRLEHAAGATASALRGRYGEWREQRREEKARRQEEADADAELELEAEPEPDRKPRVEHRRKSDGDEDMTHSPRTAPALRNRPVSAGRAGMTINDQFRRMPPPDAGESAAPPPKPPPSRKRPPARVPREVPDDDELIVQPEGGPAIEVSVQEQVQEQRADPSARQNAPPPGELPYRFPSVDLLQEADHSRSLVDYDEIEENNQILLDKLATYNIEITNINAVVGPTVTLYELTPAPGVKISRITALENDLAMAMAARGIRMIAPIPGKSAVGVEIPNRHRELVRVRDVIETARFQDSKMELPVALGKAIDGEVAVEDLAKMPHLLIAGATGSGKSVGLNTLIVGLLYACHPSNLKFVMIDPKKIELQQYAQITEHYVAMPPEADDPIITDVADALGVLKSCEKEMEQRYDLLSDAGVRSVKDYNRKLQRGRLDESFGHRHLPYIVVIVDELADLMMTAGKEIEGPIARLAQMARAVGIHLVLATQRPSVDVITGLIKANFPSRVAYQVASKVDSRTILDQNGAEGLVGNGDLLYMSGSHVVRLQGPFVSVEEVDEIMAFIGEQDGPGPYILPALEEEGSTDREAEVLEDTDELFDEAARIIVRSQQGSVSLLQRKLSVGYTRAARIVDQLEEAGIVGPFEGSKARAVLLESEMELDAYLEERREA